MRSEGRAYLVAWERLSFHQDLPPLTLLLRPEERDEQVVEVARERARAGHFGREGADERSELRGDGLVDVLPRSTVRVIKVAYDSSFAACTKEVLQGVSFVWLEEG